MVSVIIPVYKVEKYIEQCLKSVCAQTYKNFEIIIVNDGTPDNSISIARNVMCASKCRFMIIDKDNGGLSSARNRGLLEAHGDYVVFVDSDDTIQDDYIEVLLKGTEEKNAEISIGMWQMIKKGDTPISVNSTPSYIYMDRENLLMNFLYRRIKPAPVCALFKKDFLVKNDLFFNETVKFSEDQEFFWRVFNASCGASYTDRVIYNYFTRDNSITTDPKLSRILSGYNAIEAVSKIVLFKNFEMQNYILCRWVLGTLHNTAKYCSKNFYLEMYNALDAKRNLMVLSKIDDVKIGLLSKICAVNPTISYSLFKII